MSEPIYSPDGQQVWTGTGWVPVENPTPENSLTAFARNLPPAPTQHAPSNIPTYQTQYSVPTQHTPSIQHHNSSTNQIENYAKVMIDKLNRGDMKSAKDCWNQAKMIDISTTQQIFEVKYANEIANAYQLIALSELGKFEIMYEQPRQIDIEFKVKVELAPTMIELALENSTAFVPASNSFQYNYLYAMMWLYCRRFDLVWNREQSQRNYNSYLSTARSLVKSPSDIEKIRSLEYMHQQQLKDIKKETIGLVVATLFVLIIAIILFSWIASS